jgi:hypothetical protein
MKQWLRLGALVATVVLVAAGCDIVRVSVSTAGAPANGWSGNVSLSKDGTLIAFDSDATNLVAGDANGATDVFVRDARAKTTKLVSVARTGGAGNAPSYGGVLSEDGRYVAFRSTATDLVVGAPTSTTGIYLRDLLAGTTVLVNRDATGAAVASYVSPNIAISADGRFVVFVGGFHTFRYDRLVGYATQVLDDFRAPTGVSRDGRYFASETISVTGVHTRVAAVIDLSRGKVVFNGPTDSWAIRMSPDARWAAYAYAPNCFPSGVPTCTAGPSGVRLRDLVTGAEYPVLTSVGSPSREVESLALSDNGQRVAISTADNAYRFDRTTGAFTLVSAATNQVETGDAPSTGVAISGDGATVGFTSAATNLVKDDTNGVADIFTRFL